MPRGLTTLCVVVVPRMLLTAGKREKPRGEHEIVGVQAPTTLNFPLQIIVFYIVKWNEGNTLILGVVPTRIKVLIFEKVIPGLYVENSCGMPTWHPSVFF